MAKNIVLFSDGTGNSSGKLLRTNVWRMYEAVDLGPPPPKRREQIAYYDNGVGTSTFKPLALLGGVFGIGLKRNVLDIYRYVCRNYDDGDQLYGFGFSRGAFTMRLVVALIADQGLVPYTGERQLFRESKLAWRSFCAKSQPRYPFAPAALASRAKRFATRILRRLYKDPDESFADRRRPVLRFVGVWDTVAAYGGPIAEITRAIDNWIYRLSMPDYALHVDVRKARHALALDDERDSFHPLLWDEVHEDALIARKEAGEELPPWITPERLQQVWFTGMHSDVGGGYPDESLSYVSLLWMIHEAKKSELRTLPLITKRYLALANSYGPVHDSRGGVGSYYRYQPRNISAWVHPVVPSTLSLRDPSIREKKVPHGLLTKVQIHESVIARIESGTDSYAPIVMPMKFTIVPPGPGAENRPPEDEDERPKRKKDGDIPQTPLISDHARAMLEDPDRTDSMAKGMQSVWNLVWWRRVTYFTTLLLTVLLLVMPLWIAWAPEPPFLSDGRTWVGSIIGMLRFMLPAFLGGLMQTYELNAFYFLALLILIAAMWSAGTALQMIMRDRARAIWDQALAGASDGVETHTSRLGRWGQKVRMSRGYQRGLQIIKWHVLPNLFGPILLVAVLWALFGIWTQVRLPGLEKDGSLCPEQTQASRPVEVISRDFSARQTCNPMGVRVLKGQRYVVTFHVVDDWFDGDHGTDPRGLKASDMRWGVGYLGVPLRRVVGARYLEPVIEIRPDHHAGDLMHNVYLYPLKVKRAGEAPNVYRGEFKALHNGQLYLMANDSVLPFTSTAMGKYNVKYFYEKSGTGPAKDRGNRGTACVMIARADLSGDNAIKAQSPICKEASARAAALADLKSRAEELKARGQEFLVE